MPTKLDTWAALKGEFTPTEIRSIEHSEFMRSFPKVSFIHKTKTNLYYWAEIPTLDWYVVVQYWRDKEQKIFVHTEHYHTERYTLNKMIFDVKQEV